MIHLLTSLITSLPAANVSDTKSTKHLFIYSFSKVRIFVTKVFRNPFQNPLLEDPAYSAWLSGQKVFESYFESQKVQFINISLNIAPLQYFFIVSFFKQDQVLATSNVLRGVNRQRQIEFDKNLRKARNAKTLHLGPLSLRQNLLCRIPVSFHHDSNYYTNSRSSNSAKTIKHPTQEARESTW